MGHITSRFINELPFWNILVLCFSDNFPIAFWRSFIANTNAFSISPLPLNIIWMPLTSGAVLPAFFKCPLFLAAINLPFFQLIIKFWPSSFSVTLSSRSRVPCNPFSIIALRSPNVRSISSKGCAMCPYAPPSVRMSFHHFLVNSCSFTTLILLCWSFSFFGVVAMGCSTDGCVTLIGSLDDCFIESSAEIKSTRFHPSLTILLLMFCNHLLNAGWPFRSASTLVPALAPTTPAGK